MAELSIQSWENRFHVHAEKAIEVMAKGEESEREQELGPSTHSDQ